MSQKLTIEWLGHASVCIRGDAVVYIDPWNVGRSEPKADVILITHDHYDHLSLPDISALRKKDTVVVAEKTGAAKIPAPVRVCAVSERFSLKGIQITGMPAYNVGKRFHPKQKGYLGFLLRMGGYTFYHTGDSDFIPEMADVVTDVLFIPCSGTYVMDADEAIAAIAAISADIIVPIHYGAIVGEPRDAARIKEAYGDRVRLEPSFRLR